MNYFRGNMKATTCVCASWLASVLAIGVAIFSTPYMKQVLAGKAMEGPAEVLGAFVVISMFCSRPWVFALALPESQRNARRQVVFAILSFLVAGLLSFPIVEGQDAGIGASAILAVLAIWIFYPLTRMAGGK